MRHPAHPFARRSLSVVAASLLVTLAACGSSSSSSPSTAAAAATAAPTTAAPATAAPTTAAATTAAPTTAVATTSVGAATTAAGASGGTSVTATEKEFAIALDTTSFAAGTYTFKIANAGQFKHNLIIEGNGDQFKSDTFTAGQNGTLTATLKPGTYEIYCGIPTHKGKGMDLKITVP